MFKSLDDRQKSEDWSADGFTRVAVGERELIAAYVSGRNGCDCCHAIHARTAAALGIDAQGLATMMSNLESVSIDLRMRPVLSFVEKLTLYPSRVTSADAEAVFVAGWDDHALYDAVAICGLFNLMNRLVNGLGIEANSGYTQSVAQYLATGGYAGFLPLLDQANQSHRAG
jgi:uncharacterized peroxidase-related enzyme